MLSMHIDRSKSLYVDICIATMLHVSCYTIQDNNQVSHIGGGGGGG